MISLRAHKTTSDDEFEFIGDCLKIRLQGRIGGTARGNLFAINTFIGTNTWKELLLRAISGEKYHDTISIGKYSYVKFRGEYITIIVCDIEGCDSKVRISTSACIGAFTDALAFSHSWDAEKGEII